MTRSVVGSVRGSSRLAAFQVRAKRKITLKKLAVAVLFALTCSLSANAVVTEIRKDFLSETGTLSNQSVMTAPTGDGSYLIGATLVEYSGFSGSVCVSLSWTDENGVTQTITNFGAGIPHLIRNKANTAPSISTSCTFSGTYDLHVVGLGLWPSGTQGQGGITEPVNSDYAGTSSVSSTDLVTPSVATTYLVSMVGGMTPNSNGDSFALSWTDDAGNTVSTVSFSGGGYSFLVRVGAGDSLAYQVNDPDGYSYAAQINAVAFGTVATGSGPLTDYEYNLLGWTNATDPNYKTVFTAGSAGANILEACNIAEVANSGGVSEGLFGSFGETSAVPSGVPSGFVENQIVAANAAVTFYTFNTPGQEWGASPTYSAEVDVIQF
jgi:hypothetical protein